MTSHQLDRGPPVSILDPDGVKKKVGRRRLHSPRLLNFLLLLLLLLLLLVQGRGGGGDDADSVGFRDASAFEKRELLGHGPG
jgi:hypothetical protein